MRNNDHPIQIHGHRGARGLFPENSLIAIKAGIEAGCDAIEVDLCVTADNQLVIHHDLKLSSHLVRGARDASGVRGQWEWVTDNVPIRQQTLKQIQTYDIGRINPDSKYAARFCSQQAVDGTRIPTLDEFVALVKSCNRKIIYNLELKKDKDNPKYTPTDADYVDLVVQALEKHHIVERVFLQSFDLHLITAAKLRLPTLKVGWITGKKADITKSIVEKNIVKKDISVWSSHQQGLDADKVRFAHDVGLEVYAWTVNKKKDMQRMIDVGVDAIITDYPNRLFALLQKIGCR